jgi:hypothetical protein
MNWKHWDSGGEDPITGDIVTSVSLDVTVKWSFYTRKLCNGGSASHLPQKPRYGICVQRHHKGVRKKQPVAHLYGIGEMDIHSMIWTADERTCESHQTLMLVSLHLLMFYFRGICRSYIDPVEEDYKQYISSQD